MGSKLKVLSGNDVVKILSKFGFVVYGQKGSHLKMRRFVDSHIETLIIPNHNPISKGTLKSIFNQASKYISKENIYSHFFTK